MTDPRGWAFRQSVWMAVVGALALAGTAYVVLATRRGQQLDFEAKRAISGPPQVIHRFHEVLSVVSVASVAAALVVVLVLALVRRRIALAVGALILVAGANVTTQVLKYDVLTRPDYGFGTANSLPSGHTTVGLSFALAAILVAPVAWRTAVTVLASSTATMVGAGTVIAGWHRPGDVVAAVFVCFVWAAVALAVTALLSADAPEQNRSSSPHVGALLGASAVGVVVVSLDVHPVDGARGLVLSVVSLGTIGLVCAGAVATVTRVVDRAFR